jgi:hypothetical protein
MKYYAAVADDLRLPKGEKNLAEQLGGDVIRVQIGPDPIDPSEIEAAAEAVKALIDATKS